MRNGDSSRQQRMEGSRKTGIFRKRRRKNGSKEEHAYVEVHMERCLHVAQHPQQHRKTIHVLSFTVSWLFWGLGKICLREIICKRTRIEVCQLQRPHHWRGSKKSSCPKVTSFSGMAPCLEAFIAQTSTNVSARTGEITEWSMTFYRVPALFLCVSSIFSWA